MRRSVAAAALLLAAHAAAPATAPATAGEIRRPDFSGRWTLVTGRSVFGKLPGGQPKSRTDLIVHREPRLVQTLHLENPASLDTAVYRYVTDSTEVVNAVAGQEIKSRVWWEGSTLRVHSKTKLMLVLDTTLSERWTLSPDRRTLTIARHVTWPGGKGDQTLVFERR